MSEIFNIYTEEEEKELKNVIESGVANRAFFTQSMAVSHMDAVGRQGNTLQNILDTLQRIEKLLQPENQHIVIKEAVSCAMMGDKFSYHPKDAE